MEEAKPMVKKIDFLTASALVKADLQGELRCRTYSQKQTGGL